MFVTLPVSKPLKSRLVRPLQPSNIQVMSHTLPVSKLLKSRLVRPLQP